MEEMMQENAVPSGGCGHDSVVGVTFSMGL